MILRELHNKIPWDIVKEKQLSSFNLYYVYLYTPVTPQKNLFNDTNEKKKKNTLKNKRFP